MSLDTIFTLSFLPALPFWALMIGLPNWRWTRRIIASPLIIVPSALLYTLLSLPALPGAFAALGEFSLDAIAALFSVREAALIAWLHFIAVDLLAGRWAYLDSQERHISPVVMALVLLAILMFAPLGVLLYLALRYTTRPAQASNL